MLVGAERDACFAGEPLDDARFVAGFAHTLEHVGGYAPEEARRVAGTPLPDMFRPMGGHTPTTRALLFGDPHKREGD